MVPLGSDGERALDVFSKARWPSHVEEIHWTQGKAVVIDNWRVLHGRGSAQRTDRDRILLRILIR
jgi:alpha-ketoglutarate-dependent taurine dioxygenase